MRGIFAFLAAGILIGAVSWASAMLIPACGAHNTVMATWLEWCPVNQQKETETQVAALTRANQDLERRILARERELALLQCEPKAPVQAAVPPEPETIDRQDWDNRRIGLLEGCWELDSRFVTTNRQTGAETRYNLWVMCFDENGIGQEEMRADNGNSCRGPVTGQFSDDGRLLIEEPGDLPCSDGGYIYRLLSTCELNQNGTANCEVSQPEVGSSATVEFRRSSRGN